jgi:HEAT repeat protein
MFRRTRIVAMAVAGWMMGGALALAAKAPVNAERVDATAAAEKAVPDRTPPDKTAVDAAFEALKAFDWGSERKSLRPLEDAVMLSHTDAAARKDLESRLVAVVKSDAPSAAKDFACRQLSLIASAGAVPALAALLSHEELSHISRSALERIPGPEAVAAMREALPKLGGRAQAGVIVSLGSRRDAQSTAALVGLLAGQGDDEVAAAAATSLGAIGTPEAVIAVSRFLKDAPAKLRPVVADACLVGAERLLASGKTQESLAVYKSLIGPEQPRQIRMAATRGMLAASGEKP